MKDSFFLDTNIFVYSFDASAPDKQLKSRELIHKGLESGLGVISYQVIQEFLNVATKKFSSPLNSDDCKIYLSTTLRPLLHVHSSLELFSNSLELKQKFSLSFYDSLIVGAAIKSSCKTLYSEDLQDGLKIDRLQIVNPFKH